MLVISLLRRDLEFFLLPGGVWAQVSSDGRAPTCSPSPSTRLFSPIPELGSLWGLPRPPSTGNPSAGGLTVAFLFMRRTAGVFLRGCYPSAGIACALAVCGETLSESFLVRFLSWVCWVYGGRAYHMLWFKRYDFKYFF